MAHGRGGSIKAAMYLYPECRAGATGSVTSPSTIGRSAPLSEQLLGDALFDSASLHWTRQHRQQFEASAATWHATPIQTWQDALTRRNCALGRAKAPGSIATSFARILTNVFGAKVRLVTGYPRRQRDEPRPSSAARSTVAPAGRGTASRARGLTGWRDRPAQPSSRYSRPGRRRRCHSRSGVPLVVSDPRAAARRAAAITACAAGGQGWASRALTSPGVPGGSQGRLALATFDATMKDRDYSPKSPRPNSRSGPTQAVWKSTRLPARHLCHVARCKRRESEAGAAEPVSGDRTIRKSRPGTDRRWSKKLGPFAHLLHVEAGRRGDLSQSFTVFG